jgi:hypothetical protein
MGPTGIQGDHLAPGSPILPGSLVGVEQLVEAHQRHGRTIDTFDGERHERIKRIRSLQRAGKLDNDLRWVKSS